MIVSELNAENASRNTYRIARGNHGFIQETVAIDSLGEKVTVEIPGDSLIGLNIEGGETADYSLDVGPTEETEFEDNKTYSGTNIRDSFSLPDRYITVRVTTAATTGGTTATITIQESR